MDDEEAGGEMSKAVKEEKPLSSGVVYLQTVPDFVTVKRLRELLCVYGAVGKVFVQSETTRGAGGKRRRKFTEAWVEFADKRVAKRVAASLNKTAVGGRRRSKAHDSLWNIKYLNRFKWVHLVEQLAYERAVRQQRMRAEISQAKREATYFARQLDKGKHLRRLEEETLKKGGLWHRYQRQVNQRKSVNEADKRAAGEEVLDLVFAAES